MKLTEQKREILNEQLFKAVDNNDLDAVKEAVAAGADVNIRSKDGRTPLINSASNLNSIDAVIMNFLLEHGVDPNLQNFRLPL